MINLAVIGAGDWGKNLIRNFSQLPDVNFSICCDLDDKRLQYIRTHYPQLKLTKDPQDIFNDAKIDAVVICSSAVSHYQLARAALESGKHVFVEKPLTLKVSDAEHLVKLTDENKKVLMVGHLLKYHPAVTKLKTLIDSGEIGDIFYVYSQRVNLGKIRHDENALWSFAPHDLAIILYLLGEEPVEVTARGEAYLQPNIADVVFVNLTFPDKKMAHVHLSWLDPHKERKLTVVGSKKMVVFDDMESSDKIKIYDKGADRAPGYETYAEYITLRSGDVIIPALKLTEPLKNECLHFIDCIKNNKTPLSDGRDGLKVVKILTAAQQSLEQGGKPVRISNH
ncbi:MAG: Gfo/Idh/MocA family oxidoreductase [Planctomycetota bacterium]